MHIKRKVIPRGRKNAQDCVIEVQAKGTISSPQDAERRFLQVAKSKVYFGFDYLHKSRGQQNSCT